MRAGVREGEGELVGHVAQVVGDEGQAARELREAASLLQGPGLLLLGQLAGYVRGHGGQQLLVLGVETRSAPGPHQDHEAEQLVAVQQRHQHPGGGPVLEPVGHRVRRARRAGVVGFTQVEHPLTARRELEHEGRVCARIGGAVGHPDARVAHEALAPADPEPAARAVDDAGHRAHGAHPQALVAVRSGERRREATPCLAVVVAVGEEIAAEAPAQDAPGPGRGGDDHQQEQAGEEEGRLEQRRPVAAGRAQKQAGSRQGEQVETDAHQHHRVHDGAAREAQPRGPGGIARGAQRDERRHNGGDGTPGVLEPKAQTAQQQRLRGQEEIEGEQGAHADTNVLDAPAHLARRPAQQQLREVEPDHGEREPTAQRGAQPAASLLVRRGAPARALEPDQEDPAADAAGGDPGRAAQRSALGQAGAVGQHQEEHPGPGRADPQQDRRCLRWAARAGLHRDGQGPEPGQQRGPHERREGRPPGRVPGQQEAEGQI